MKTDLPHDLCCSYWSNIFPAVASKLVLDATFFSLGFCERALQLSVNQHGVSVFLLSNLNKEVIFVVHGGLYDMIVITTNLAIEFDGTGYSAVLVRANEKSLVPSINTLFSYN